MINYYLITKPGIILGNLVTVGAGFLLAAKGIFHFWLFVYTLTGMGFIMASACVFNNYIDRKVDKKMKRTKRRALAQGIISKQNALIFGSFLGLIGFLVLGFFTNILTAIVAGIGFFVYVFPYSMWKCKTIYGTAIGSIAGAVPPVVGYCAVSNSLDMGAIILFLMMVLWQMPHFFAISLYHLEDYKNAQIPVLPVVKGPWKTKIHMAIYIAGFIITAALLTFFHYTGYVYLFVIICVGFAWLALSLSGFQRKDNQRWGGQMFRFSLVVIGVISLVIPLDLRFLS